MAAPQAIFNIVFATAIGFLVYLLLNPNGDILIGFLASLIGSLTATAVFIILLSMHSRK